MQTADHSADQAASSGVKGRFDIGAGNTAATAWGPLRCGGASGKRQCLNGASRAGLWAPHAEEEKASEAEGTAQAPAGWVSGTSRRGGGWQPQKAKPAKLRPGGEGGPHSASRKAAPAKPKEDSSSARAHCVHGTDFHHAGTAERPVTAPCWFRDRAAPGGLPAPGISAAGGPRLGGRAAPCWHPWVLSSSAGQKQQKEKQKKDPPKCVPEPVQGYSLQSPYLGEGAQPSLHSLPLSPHPVAPHALSLGEGQCRCTGAWREEGVPAPCDLEGGEDTPAGPNFNLPPRNAAHSTDEGKLMDRRKSMTPIIQTGKNHRKKRF